MAQGWHAYGYRSPGGKITGPYEGRVALQDLGVAQGGLIDTPDGNWYRLLVPRFWCCRSHTLSGPGNLDGWLACAWRER